MSWQTRSKRKRAADDHPENFVKGWMALTLPSATPVEAELAVRHLRSKGWTEQQLADFILPYMPREPPPPPAAAPGVTLEAPQAISVPPGISTAWLDEHLPAMDRRQLRLVVDELERRGWSPGSVALAVLPHLLPTLPAEDARAVVAGLADLGMTDDEIARATARP